MLFKMFNKDDVKTFWEQHPCGARYASDQQEGTFFKATEDSRQVLDPDVPGFAEFETYNSKRVLEVGTGIGVDHLNWYRAGADVRGIDLTEAAISHTRARLRHHGFSADAGHLERADVEKLPFSEGMFDLVYSWGVLHHTPDTENAFSEVCRVLKSGGELKAMVYHHPSWVALMIYVRHGLFGLKPFTSPKKLVAQHLESPGTKAYTLKEIGEILARAGFSEIKLTTRLSAGDLLQISLSEKYQAPLYKFLKALYPGWLVRLLGHRFGLNLLIRATK